MKTRDILFLAALASTVFTGCTNDDEAGQGQLPDLSGTPIRIQAGIGEKVLTRTGEDETPQVTVLTEGEFGLFLTTTEAPDDKRYNATNMKFSYADGGWTSEEQLLWKNSTATVNYYAYMPHTATENLTEETEGNYSLTVAVQETQTAENIKEADFLYYKSQSPVTATTNEDALGTINITFEHQLSYLTVKLTRLETAEDVTFSSVTLQGCAMSATFNLAGGEFVSEDGTTEKKDISLWHATTVTGGGENTTDAFEGILIPQSFHPMTILISGTDSEGNTKNYKYVSSSEESLTLASGKSYTLALNVGNAVTRVGTVSVAPWGDSTWTEEQSKGKAEEIVSGANATTHTITTVVTGEITSEWIKTAIGEGTDTGDGTKQYELKIEGPMNDDDIATIKGYLKDNPVTGLDLNLTDAGITALPDNKEYLLPDYREWPGVKSIVLPEGLTTIGDFAFQKCPDLASVTLPSTLKYIGFGAFAHCAGLTEVSLPASLEEFNMCAFYGCSGLTSIDLSKTQVGIISNGAFQNCTGLEKVILCSSVKTLDYYSFSGCTSLKTIDLSLCEEIPGRKWENDNNYAFKDVDKTGITVYVKDAALKTAFEASFWVTHEGFTADNCQVKQ